MSYAQHHQKLLILVFPMFLGNELQTIETKKNISFSSKTTHVEKLSTSLQEKWSKNEVDIFATKLLYEANENSDFNLSKQ